jgi:hypothetical protein
MNIYTANAVIPGPNTIQINSFDMSRIIGNSEVILLLTGEFGFQAGEKVLLHNYNATVKQPSGIEIIRYVTAIHCLTALCDNKAVWELFLSPFKPES